MASYQLPLIREENTSLASSAHARQVSSIPRRNGTVNRLSAEDNAAHDWYRFVLSFPPHLVRDYLQRFRMDSSHLVLDPFCGTGTTMVECKKLGIPSVGIEAHPMAHLAASTKVNWHGDSQALDQHASAIAARTRSLLAQQAIPDFPSGRPNGKHSRELLSLPVEASRLLLRDSISPLPLHKVLLLLQALRENSAPDLAAYENLALAKALVTTIGNLHFGPEVGLGQIKTDAPVIAPWLQMVERTARDLRALRPFADVPATVILADARQLPEFLPPRSIDAVFTSPPYPNEKDYTRTTRLESVLLGFIQDRQDLKALKRTLIRSNTRGVYKDDSDDAWILNFPEIIHLAEQIETRRNVLGKTSGFERMYHRVALQYFGGMARHLAGLRGCLRPGAMLGYVVGDQASYLQVLIKTGSLLGKIAQSLGYELVATDLFRTRLATATRQQLREEIVVLRWSG